MKHILIFIFFSLSFALFGQNDTHPNFTQSQLDSALKGTKYIDIPSHFNSNGDKNTWDIDLKDLGDVINGKSNPSQIIALQDTTGCTSWTSASTNFQTDMPTADSLLFITINGINYPINLPMDDGSTGSIPPATAALMQTAIGNAITSAGYSATTSVGASGIFTNITYQLTAGNSPLTIQYTIKTGGFYNNLVIAKSVPYNCTYTNRPIKPTDTQLAVNTCPAITLAYSEGDLDTLRVYDCNTNDWRIVGAEHDYNYSLSPLIVGVDTTGFILNKNGIPQDTVLLCSGGGNTVVDTRLQLSVANDSLKVEVIDVATNVVLSTSYFDDVINKVDTTKWELGGNTLSLPKYFGTKTNTNIPLLLNNVNVGEFRTSDSFVNNAGTGLATSGNPRIRFGTSNYTDDDAAILIHRKIDGNLLFSHAIRDESEFETDGPGAYTPFDAAFTFKGNTPSVNHMGAFQSRNNYANSGTLNAMYSLTSRFNLNGGLVENLYDMYMFPIYGANQTYNNRYGVFMEYHTQPNTYFLYSAGPSPSYLGGVLQTAGDIISTGNISANNVWSNNGFNSTGLGIGARTASTAGFYQTLIGHNAGTNLTASATLFNTYIGASSGFTGTTVNRNTYIGAYAGYLSTGSDNIFIGKDAGYNELGSNKLYISNSNTSTPLLGGDFSTQELKIGGVQQFSVQYPTSGAGVTNGSIFYGTDGGLYFKGGSGTVTLVAAP